MRVVLTGGSGFLGGALATRLHDAGHTLVLPARREIRHGVAIPSIADMTAAEWTPIVAGADAVVHAAAIAHIGSSVPPGDYGAVNRDASARLAQAAAGAGVQRFVFISSIRAQVGAASAERQDEASAESPTEPYGRSKLEAERLIRGVFPDAVVLRPALIVGPHPKGNLAALLRLAALPLPLPFGGLVAPQAMASLGGVADAALMALGRADMAGQTYCLAEEPHLSLADMLAAMRRGLGRPARLFSVPAGLAAAPLRLLGRSAMADRLTVGLRVDSTRLRALGWRPDVPLVQVLEDIAAKDVAAKDLAARRRGA